MCMPGGIHRIHKSVNMDDQTCISKSAIECCSTLAYDMMVRIINNSNCNRTNDKRRTSTIEDVISAVHSLYKFKYASLLDDVITDKFIPKHTSTD